MNFLWVSWICPGSEPTCLKLPLSPRAAPWKGPQKQEAVEWFKWGLGEEEFAPGADHAFWEMAGG